MKLGINGATTMPYTLEEDIVAAGKVGFDTIEIWYSKLLTYLETHSIEELNELIATAKLKVDTICPTGIHGFSQNKAFLTELKAAAKLAQQLNCSTILACPDAPTDNTSKEEAIRKFALAAREAADIVADFGVRIALEPLGGHPYLAGPSEALQVLDIADRTNLGLMMDTFHYYKSDVLIEEIQQIPIEKLFIIHVNDCDDLPKNRLQDKDRLYPTQGIIPAKKMIEPLIKKGYSGSLSVEVFRPAFWEKPIDDINQKAFESVQNLMDTLKGGVSK